MSPTRRRKILRSGWGKALTVFLLILMFSRPVVAQQAKTMAEACAEAQMDAKAEVNTTVWLLAGCLGGVPGLLISYIYDPSPPAMRLLGKSPEYVAAYTDCYKERAKKIQTNKAWTGCAVAAGAYLVYVYLLMSMVASLPTE